MIDFSKCRYIFRLFLNVEDNFRFFAAYFYLVFSVCESLVLGVEMVLGWFLKEFVWFFLFLSKLFKFLSIFFYLSYGVSKIYWVINNEMRMYVSILGIVKYEKMVKFWCLGIFKVEC